jgi:nucleoside-diphosphate-sugar epimerase
MGRWLPLDRMARLLITGGAGFIGGRVAALALEAGHAVTVLDDLSTGRAERLAALEAAGVRAVRGDLRDPEARSNALDAVDAVVHLAAQVSVARSVEDPQETASINVHATEALSNDMAARGVQRLVLASSAAVYGDAVDLPLDEDAVGQRLSPYADSKWANEQEVVRRRSEGWEALALRFFNVYGTGQRSDGAYAAVVPAFVDRMCSGRAPRILGTGEQTRDFVHVDDVAGLLLHLATSAWRPTPRHAYNVATGRRVSLLDLVHAVAGALRARGEEGAHLSPEFGPPRPGDITDSLASVDAIRTDLGWQAAVPLDEGLAKMVDERLANASG